MSARAFTQPLRICAIRIQPRPGWLASLFLGWIVAWASLSLAQVHLDPFQVPTRSIRQFVQEAASLDPTTLVKVEGTVTLHHPSGSIFLQDATGAVYAEGLTTNSLNVGDQVEVVGRVLTNGFSPILHQCQYRVLGKKGTVTPTPVTGGALRTGRLDMELIQVRGRLLTGPTYRGESQLLLVAVDELPVMVELTGVEEHGPLSQLRRGSVIQATGVCSIGGSRQHQPSTYRLQLRSANDVVVRAPPSWWTPGRVGGALVLAGTLVLAALGWVLSLRHQVRKQTEQISEQLRHEAALEERYRRIVDTALEGIVLLDEKGHIAFLNRHMAELLGYAPAEMLNRPLLDFAESGTANEAKRLLSQASSGQPRKFDMPLRHRDGSTVWTSAARNSFLDERGNEVGTLLMMANISERKLAEQHILQLNRVLEERVAERTRRLQETVAELEQYSYSISHDMRGPLRAMSQFSTILLEDYANRLDAEGQDYLKRIAAAARRMDDLIQDVLHYSRVSREELPLARIDLERLVTELKAQYPTLQGADIIVERPLLPVLANEAALTQCLSNLLGNAVKFVAPGVKPTLRIRTQPAGAMVRVWVEDNGIGISPEHLQRIWGIFNRLHGNDAYEGTGIGLSIVKKAIERMGGTVGVESEPQKGSRFWFELRAPS